MLCRGGGCISSVEQAFTLTGGRLDPVSELGGWEEAYYLGGNLPPAGGAVGGGSVGGGGGGWGSVLPREATAGKVLKGFLE